MVFWDVTPWNLVIRYQTSWSQVQEDHSLEIIHLFIMEITFKYIQIVDVKLSRAHRAYHAVYFGSAGISHPLLFACARHCERRKKHHPLRHGQFITFTSFAPLLPVFSVRHGGNERCRINTRTSESWCLAASRPPGFPNSQNNSSSLCFSASCFRCNSKITEDHCISATLRHDITSSSQRIGSSWLIWLSIWGNGNRNFR